MDNGGVEKIARLELRSLSDEVVNGRCRLHNVHCCVRFPNPFRSIVVCSLYYFVDTTYLEVSTQESVHYTTQCPMPTVKIGRV